MISRKNPSPQTKESGRIYEEYRVDCLVYYEALPDMTAAIAREKQLKGWRREKKIALIEKMNRGWDDLVIDLLERNQGPSTSSGLKAKTG